MIDNVVDKHLLPTHLYVDYLWSLRTSWKIRDPTTCWKHYLDLWRRIWKQHETIANSHNCVLATCTPWLLWNLTILGFIKSQS